ncbi:hypothetical protein ACTXP3_27600, partial [Klebsiella pneumoniae]|uniref:hypothetical protein n=1 Tax=Klebsiella pneumoniae TaxID=573 RepID=UPI003FD0EE65
TETQLLAVECAAKKEKVKIVKPSKTAHSDGMSVMNNPSIILNNKQGNTLSRPYLKPHCAALGEL